MRAALAAAAGCSCLAASALHAQGALGTLGFGYPSGQLSTRALGAGGALADFDPNSPLNPAALAVALRSLVYVQYDPEFRGVSIGGGTSTNTLTARFPVFGVSGRVAGFNIGLSFASFLDRTWTNVYADTQRVGGQAVPSTVTALSSGGINDVRAAIAYSFGPKFHVGFGLHVFPGENRTLIGRAFTDTVQFGAFNQANIFNFSGSAVSFGVLAVPVSHFTLAASGRVGGVMHMRAGDSTVVGTAHVPDRWSASAAYDGFGGSVFAVRYATEKWSSMRGLGSPGLPINDATEFSAGGEIAGPKVSGVPMALRLGYRSRDLPFSLDATKVKEQSATAGLGIPFSNGRGSADLSGAPTRRSAGDARETGWILSFGIGIRP
jgi:hypothetical protein